MDEIQENTDAAMREMAAKVKQVSEYYFRTFTSDTGKTVLEHLEEMTTDLSVLSGNDLFDVNVNVNPEQLVMMREGQNSLVRYIKRMLKYYGDNK